MRACAILGLLAGGEALTWVAAWHTIARHAVLELAIALIPLLLLLLLLLLLWHVALLRQVHLLLGELRWHGNVGMLRHELLLLGVPLYVALHALLPGPMHLLHGGRGVLDLDGPLFEG